MHSAESRLSLSTPRPRAHQRLNRVNTAQTIPSLVGPDLRASLSVAATMWWLISASSSAIFLLSIVLSIPIAFDVGGRDAGLAYSLSLFLFYTFYSISKLVTPEKSRVRWFLKTLIGLSQWIVIPTLLIWSLNRFSVDAGSTGWVSRTFSQITSTHHKTWKEWFFGQEGFVETVALGAWDNTLSYSSPVFQLLEGFCTLLVIQAAGQITRWLVNRGRSDTWVVSLVPFL